MLNNEANTPVKTYNFYSSVWRWHFYTGLFVIPFLLILSLSGLLMLITKPVENWLTQPTISIPADTTKLSSTSLLNIVRTNYPNTTVLLFVPPKSNEDYAQFSLKQASAHGHSGHNAPSTTVQINPYSGEILGELDSTASIYEKIKTLHGSLFLGSIGDNLIEIATGLSIMMILTGLYMAWPKISWRTLVPNFIFKTQEDWRRLHKSLGVLIAIPLLLFLFSGLAWTDIWGGKLVQPWSYLPGSNFKAPKVSDQNVANQYIESKIIKVQKNEHNHELMNHAAVYQVPWALEKIPLPESIKSSDNIDLEKVINIAKEQNFNQYRVHFPKDETGVWTISATTIAGDITNPSMERTLHLDQSNGETLADFKFEDYSALGMAMSAFIPFHQGDLGLWNWLLNVAIVLLVLLLIISGATQWWKRRPKNKRKIGAPSAPKSANKIVILIMLLVSVFFPLSAAALLLIISIDILFISRLKSLKAVLK
ncbi:membrane protein [Thalassotalea profundi]|uniref:Membrane protein n=2 Tax=Thalassotalea profundi TaxID=2036687 RepID=A0ABQ3IIM1_9GAMM|nr:membrane protein [Thalassotalea profundi]